MPPIDLFNQQIKDTIVNRVFNLKAVEHVK